MCGIVGYCGPRKVVPVILEGLRRLEYRGYDSAGVVYLQDGKLIKHRAEGKLINLENRIGDAIVASSQRGALHDCIEFRFKASSDEVTLHVLDYAGGVDLAAERPDLQLGLRVGPGAAHGRTPRHASPGEGLGRFDMRKGREIKETPRPKGEF